MQIGFQKYLMYSLFIAYGNDEWCRFVVHIAIGSPPLISFYYMYLLPSRASTIKFFHKNS